MSLKFPTDPNQISKICKKYDIKNYTIREGGVIDVIGDVNLIEKNLTKLPLRFGNVTGRFWCFDNKLTSLEGSPDTITDDFDCFSNVELTSLLGAPKYVGGRFDCSYTSITDLEGSPDHIETFFYCCSTKITSLIGLPKTIRLGFSCQGSKNLCDPAELRDLIVEEFFRMDQTPIKTLIDVFENYDDFRYSLDYNYFRMTENGPALLKWKLDEALKEVDKTCPDSIEGYIFI